MSVTVVVGVEFPEKRFHGGQWRRTGAAYILNTAHDRFLRAVDHVRRVGKGQVFCCSRDGRMLVAPKDLTCVYVPREAKKFSIPAGHCGTRRADRPGRKRP